MHLEGFTLYNNVHLKNIKTTILNEDIYALVKKLVDVQENEFINDDLPLIKELNSKVKLKYPKEFMMVLFDRINISQKLLKI